MEVHGSQRHGPQGHRERLRKQGAEGHGAHPKHPERDPAGGVTDRKPTSASGPLAGAAGSRAASLSSPTELAGASKPPVLVHGERHSDHRGDVVELSDAAGALSDTERAREAKVQDLRRALESGTLLNHEHIERAALGLLLG